MQRRLIKFCILLSVFSDSLQAVDKLERQIQLIRAERNPVEDAVVSMLLHFRRFIKKFTFEMLQFLYIRLEQV